MTTQKILERLVLEVSGRVGDGRTNYLADGKTYPSKRLIDSVNGAYKKIYNTKLEGMGDDEFLEFYPEFKIVREYRIQHESLDSKALVLADDVRKIIGDVSVVSLEPVVNRRAGQLSAKQYIPAMTDKYNNRKPSLTNPKWSQQGRKINIELAQGINNRIVISSGSVFVTIMLQPLSELTGSLTGPDIVCPPEWETDIIDMGTEYVFTGRQD